MNKHIELVKKWLANKDSVSLEQLAASKVAAAQAADDASYAAAYSAYCAIKAAAQADAAADDAAYWVKRYEELTNE